MSPCKAIRDLSPNSMIPKWNAWHEHAMWEAVSGGITEALDDRSTIGLRTGTYDTASARKIRTADVLGVPPGARV